MCQQAIHTFEKPHRIWIIKGSSQDGDTGTKIQALLSDLHVNKEVKIQPESLSRESTIRKSSGVFFFVFFPFHAQFTRADLCGFKCWQWSTAVCDERWGRVKTGEGDSGTSFWNVALNMRPCSLPVSHVPLMYVGLLYLCSDLTLRLFLQASPIKVCIQEEPHADPLA